MTSAVFSPKPNRPRLIIRRIVGKSMIPSFWPGQLLLATGHFRKLAAGDVVIVLHDGLEKIKRVQRIDGDKLYIVGDNPANSVDSRQFGWVPQESVRAKVVWPRRNAPDWERLNRF